MYVAAAETVAEAESEAESEAVCAVCAVAQSIIVHSY